MQPQPTHAHMQPLGWLPLTLAARRDGFLPVYRKLRSEGKKITEWGYLKPDLYWRHGRGYGEPALEGAYVLQLLLRSAQEALHLSKGHEIVGPHCRGSPEYLTQQVPDLAEVFDAWSRNDFTSIRLSSPLLPPRLTRSAWLETLPRLLPSKVLPRLDVLSRDPARLVRVGYQMLCSEWETHGQSRRQTGEALGVIGIGVLGLFPRVRCGVCYRLSMPGSNRCAHHSQAKTIRATPAELNMHSLASARARLATQVVTLLRWQPDDFATDRGEDCKAEEKTITGLLWGYDWGSANHSIEHLQKLMRGGVFPRVRARLPQDFCDLSTARANATLRRYIDPGEWVPSYWLSRVAAAEAWLEAADSLSPGRTHMEPSEINQKRVGVARSLIQQGVAKKEIALRLGISPSHLSHLLRRMK